jgi:hypothetical protein
MPDPAKDNFGKWCMLVVGSLMVTSAIPKLYVYLMTGNIFYGHSKSVPFDLDGSNAALVYGFYLLIGLFVLVAGIRGLLGK